MSGVRSLATVANVVSYVQTVIAREGFGHDRHRTVYNNLNDVVRVMQEAINAAARGFHPRDTVAATRASLLTLDTIFKRAVHQPKPDRFGNISGRYPFLLAIASVKLYDLILLAVRDNRFIYLAHRMALDLLDGDKRLWLAQWTRTQPSGPWDVMAPNSWDPRIPQPSTPRHRNEPHPAFRPPCQAMLSPTDFDVFEATTVYPIQLGAAGSLSLRTVSKIL